MIRRCAYAIAAMGGFVLNGAFGETFPGVGQTESEALEAAAEIAPAGSAAKTSGPREPSPSLGANPLWGVPLSALRATLERPLFSPSRRPPAPPPAALPVAEAPPPPPPEPEHPLLALLGTVVGGPQNIAVVRDQSTNSLVRVRVGEAVSGWTLRTVEPRSVTVEKDSHSVTVALPAPGSAPSVPPSVPVAYRDSRQF